MDFDDDDMMMGSDDAFSDQLSDFGEGEEMEDTAENLYYKAKTTIDESVEQAVEELRRAVERDTEEGRSEYGFKALKKLVKMALRGQVPLDKSSVLRDYEAMLGYTGTVSANMAEKGVGTLVDLAAAAGDLDLTEQLVAKGAASFQANKNDRAWFRVNLKLAQVLFEASRTEGLKQRLDELVRWCELAEGVNDPKKEPLLLEVLALLMQCVQTQSAQRSGVLRRLVARAQAIQSAIPHPRTVAAIRECSGKVMMDERRWSQAKQEFFDAFKNYDESGSPRRVQCLRYLVLAALLENSRINPFESPETKSFASNSAVAPVLGVWLAYEDLDVRAFERALAASGDAFADDAFVREFVPLLVRNVRQQKLLQLVQAYRRMRLEYLARELGLADDECEAMVAQTIRQGLLDAAIDQQQRALVLHRDNDADAKCRAMAQWSRHIACLTASIDKKFV